ncbi:MAG: polysaccharide deacetylase family protein [Acidimicrobiales bacterium]
MTTLAKRLGYRDDDRLLIINCDDLGCSQAANAAIFDALRNGSATSASLMVPCPWARSAAADYRGEDVGVHLTLNAELDIYRWGPITWAPSLLDGDGGFPRTVTDVFEHADTDEVRRECRAQIERAILWGFDVSHIDSHLATLQLRPELFDVYLDLAEEFVLPLRLSSPETERMIGFPFRRLAAERGVVFPDYLVSLGEARGTRQLALSEAIANLAPGVTETYLHPATDTPELRAMSPQWQDRVADHAALLDHGHLSAALERAGVVLLGYRELRALMRAEHRRPTDAPV